MPSWRIQRMPLSSNILLTVFSQADLSRGEWRGLVLLVPPMTRSKAPIAHRLFLVRSDTRLRATS